MYISKFSDQIATLLKDSKKAIMRAFKTMYINYL